MESNDKERIQGIYEDAFKNSKTNARKVHWNSKYNQEIRFEVLSKIAILDNKSVLDVGCGLGDLYVYLNSKNIHTIYTGIDIVPLFVSEAQRLLPKADIKLQDVFLVNEQYDYVLASGSLNINIADAKNYYFKMIKKMFECAKYGLAFNMLNAAQHITNDTFIAYDIDEVSKYCKTLTGKVTVVTGYLPHDFTVYMYK